MIIDCISDLHGFFPELEGGDLLIIAGDMTARGTAKEYMDFFAWFKWQDYRKKIFIGGNHDSFFQQCIPTSEAKMMGVHDDDHFDYLFDSGTEFEGLKIWGSPWSLWFKGVNPKCTAFMGSEDDLEKKFALIPEDTDILITHSPAYGILDGVTNFSYGKSYWCGSKSLWGHIKNRIKPKLHIFGHIHEMGGHMVDAVTTKFVNASYVNERYEPVNKPVRIEL